MTHNNGGWKWKLLLVLIIGTAFNYPLISGHTISHLAGFFVFLDINGLVAKILIGEWLQKHNEVLIGDGIEMKEALKNRSLIQKAGDFNERVSLFQVHSFLIVDTYIFPTLKIKYNFFING
ncbi:hypothetical protein M5W68_00530 [Paenibacillus larvae]|uniref:hypothetical protein n=1 Tax=Paenibacillus larvae TaxID=1464 RepID=UPI00227FF6CB|nr:hypothetical protein [Paenibacillus larvae]MCY9511516.1 hypothetical protein [Paenibacillus larvae]MCY9523669.1 hypothetical protein [Paenibacillus larvae]